MTYEDTNLRILGVFHYVFGGFVALFSMIPLIYLGLGLLFSLSPAVFESSKGVSEAPPVIVGLVFSGIGLVGVLVIATLAVLMFLAGRNIHRTRNLNLCTVTAALACFFMPFGTILGVLTLVELNKREVRDLFEQAKAAPAAVRSAS